MQCDNESVNEISFQWTLFDTFWTRERSDGGNQNLHRRFK